MFVRPYPASGVKVIPMAFGAGANGYFLLSMLPVASTLWFMTALHNLDPIPPIMQYGLVISLLGLFSVIVLARRLRLEIGINGISYTGAFKGSRFIAFSEISTVVLIDYRHLRSEATPRRSVRSFTMIITPNVDTGKASLKVPLTLFSDSARRELVRLFKPEEWESGT
jgi:hypothetical protein